MNPNQKKPANAPRHIPKKAVIIIILIVVLATIGFALLGYRTQNDKRQAQEAFAADKAAFAKVEVEMARAYEAMVAAAGKPDKVEQYKNCSRTASKFKEGQLGCGVSYEFQYRTESAGDAYERMKVIESYLINSTGISTKFDRTKNTEQIVSSSFDGVGESICDLYLKSDVISESRSVVSENNLRTKYSYTCGKDVASPIYPLAQ